MNTKDSIAILNGRVLTVEDDAVIEGGTVIIEDGVISYVGEDSSRAEGCARTIDASGCAVLPGFVNSHTHIASNMLLRSLNEDAELWAWLRSMWRMKRNFEEETLYWASLCGLIEMAKGGMTTFNEHFDAYAVSPEIEALKKVPLRATLGYGFADRGIYESIAPWSWSTLEHFGDRVAKFHNTMDGRLQVALSPHAPYSVGAEMWKLSREVADEHQVSIHTHLAEGMNEVRYMWETYGTTTIQWLDSMGILGPDVTGAHCPRLDKRDIELMAQNDVKIAHCPISNAKLASGMLDIGAVRNAGLTVGLATDGPASHNTLDMFQEMKFAGLMHKDRTQDSTFLKAEDIVGMATRGSALAMHRPEVGHLVEGAAGDVIVVDLDKPHVLPAYEVHPSLVYSSRADDVVYTIVGGDLIVDEGVVSGVDEAEVRARFRESALALKARSL